MALPALYANTDPLGSLADAEKVKLLERLEQLARAADTRVTQVMATIAGSWETMLVARSDGHLAADVRPLARVSITVILEANGKREQGSAGGGGRFDYGYFSDAVLAEYAHQAIHQASVNLDARPAPAGEMTVVLGNGWPGILLHEAIGHGLEGDFNRKGSSAFSGRMGQRVAAKGVTVVDDGTIPDRRGSLSVDDEGNPTQRTVLIEDGILVGYLQDALNARLMGVAPTGNGRRESFAHMPLPRMTNTTMLAGDKDPQEIIASVKKGLYAANFGGGQVDITSGKFVFSAAEAYLIENGKIGAPVKGATLIGNGPDVLTTRLDDRQRPGARPGRRHLRQGRPERAGRRRPADPAHRRPDRGRHVLSRRILCRACGSGVDLPPQAVGQQAHDGQRKIGCCLQQRHELPFTDFGDAAVRDGIGIRHSRLMVDQAHFTEHRTRFHQGNHLGPLADLDTAAQEYDHVVADISDPEHRVSGRELAHGCPMPVVFGQ